MNQYELGFKDLEEVVIKTTSNIEVNNKIIKANETIAAFDKIQIAAFTENTSSITAHGGYGDRDKVWWDSVKNLQLIFTQGIFSEQQLSVMTNSKLLDFEEPTAIYLNERKIIESDESGKVILDEDVYDYVFFYDIKTGNRYDDFTYENPRIFEGFKPYTEYLIDYCKRYNDKTLRVINFGSQLTNGFLTLQGKTRVKDDITGLVRTAIITIPKLKLMTGLSMKLGKNAIPVVGQFNSIACPVGSNGNSKVMEIAFLDDYLGEDAL